MRTWFLITGTFRFPRAAGAAAILAAAAATAQGVTYELLASSTILDECRDCDRIPIERPLAGTFLLTPGADVALFSVTGVDLASPESEYTVKGAGTYRQDFLEKPTNEMSLTVSINGVDGIQLESGVVPPGEEWPVIDIVLKQPVSNDPNHIYTLRLRAAPQPRSWVRYELVPGDGEKGSFFVDDCLPCARPTILIPIGGSFMLGEIDPGANWVVTYVVGAVDFKSVSGTQDYQMSGGGIYRQGGHLALTQEMRLILQVNQDRGAILASEKAAPPVAFPALEIDLKHENPVSDIHVYSLHLVANPVERIPRFKRGDANASGDLNIADAVFALTHLFRHGPAPCKDALDANNDGQLNVADPIAILGHLFAHAGDLPEPFKSCGVDTGDVTLGCESFTPCDGAP